MPTYHKDTVLGKTSDPGFFVWLIFFDGADGWLIRPPLAHLVLRPCCRACSTIELIISI